MEILLFTFFSFLFFYLDCADEFEKDGDRLLIFFRAAVQESGLGLSPNQVPDPVSEWKRL